MKYKKKLGLIVIPVMGLAILLLSHLHTVGNVKAEEIEVPVEIEGIFNMSVPELRRISNVDLDYENETDMLRRATAYYWMSAGVAIDPYIDNPEIIKRNEQSRIEIFEYLKEDNLIVNRLREDKAFKDSEPRYADYPWTQLHYELTELDFGGDYDRAKLGTNVAYQLYQNDESVEIGDLTIDFASLELRDDEILIDLFIRTNDGNTLTFDEIESRGLTATVTNNLVNETGIENRASRLELNEAAHERLRTSKVYTNSLPQYYALRASNVANVSDILGVEANLIENFKDEIEALGLLRDRWFGIFNTDRSGLEYGMHYDFNLVDQEQEEDLMELLYYYRNQFPEELVIRFNYYGHEVNYTLPRGKQVSARTIGLYNED